MDLSWRVFGGGARMRYLTISVRGPENVETRSFHVTSNAADWSAKAGVQGTSKQISVCVPAHGFADVHISTRHFSPIYGDPRSEESFFSYARSGGVLVTGTRRRDRCMLGVLRPAEELVHDLTDRACDSSRAPRSEGQVM